jgi:hypothetical protein
MRPSPSHAARRGALLGEDVQAVVHRGGGGRRGRRSTPLAPREFIRRRAAGLVEYRLQLLRARLARRHAHAAARCALLGHDGQAVRAGPRRPRRGGWRRRPRGARGRRMQWGCGRRAPLAPRPLVRRRAAGVVQHGLILQRAGLARRDGHATRCGAAFGEDVQAERRRAGGGRQRQHQRW